MSPRQYSPTEIKTAATPTSREEGSSQWLNFNRLSELAITAAADEKVRNRIDKLVDSTTKRKVQAAFPRDDYYPLVTSLLFEYWERVYDLEPDSPNEKRKENIQLMIRLVWGGEKLLKLAKDFGISDASITQRIGVAKTKYVRNPLVTAAHMRQSS